MNRRDFVGASGTAILASLMGADKSASAADSAEAAGLFPGSPSSLKHRPNIILFMPDELRADALSCYGNPVCKTPNFDRFAGEGVRFSNCHVQFPVCGASRCSLLTGWPTSVRGHRSLYYFLRPEDPNLFRYLRQADYDVFWFGKNDALASASFSDSVTEWAEPSGGSHADVHDLTPGTSSMLLSAGGDRRETHDYQMLQKAVGILERRQSERPFCIFLPLLEPHPPYTVPQDFYDLYLNADIPQLAPPGLPNKPSYHAGMRELYNLKTLSSATLRKVRAVYYGQVSYSDWLLGELMAAIDRTGHTDDTALFLFSDHGDFAGDYGLTEKWPSALEDCLTHVPLVARVPGNKNGGICDNMVELYDVMQTCLDLAGTQAHHTHFARSLVPQLKGGSGDPNRSAFAEAGYNAYEPQCFEPLGAVGPMYAAKIRLQNDRPETVSRAAMVRTRTHKLIVRPQGQSELYHNASDPQERENLYGDQSVRTIQGDLEGQLLAHFINTSGIAPYDKDPRGAPPFIPTRTDLAPANWQQKLLDE